MHRECLQRQKYFYRPAGTLDIGRPRKSSSAGATVHDEP
jgi:hypothetical protein